ncbi:cell division suppressor protein YneA [Parageobacillus toebii NBRC 107807]|uniref:Cell division protein YceG involved in septum cleavage n=1 Tax=Parageobacillus toebii NBRC 107807 TaxID=1223503 RepID=A0A6G9J4R0_9BACL|nr:cell division suppressor protein YneA [Parageobacillus toebii]MBB3867766.1 cell division protein YceG involved in septum cleavage [Parageobacillus toebii NBRC 107807]QIQ33217.1 cell division suppressor protein YneA [Parageobacillus toebii NBRC 107807]
MKRMFVHYIIFSALLLMVIGAFLYANKPLEKDKYMEITVASGDTLWKLAKEYEGQHQLSTTEFINWVIDVNHLSSQRIVAGEKIVIPVLKSKEDKSLVVSK